MPGIRRSTRSRLPICSATIRRAVDAEVKEVDGIRVRVATPAALYQLKRGTVRPLDHQDAEARSALWAGRGKLKMPVEKFRSADEMQAEGSSF
jgi:hypothetical protein